MKCNCARVKPKFSRSCDYHSVSLSLLCPPLQTQAAGPLHNNNADILYNAGIPNQVQTEGSRGRSRMDFSLLFWTLKETERLINTLYAGCVGVYLKRQTEGDEENT